MALVKCKECGSKVSSKAADCPQCGARINKGMGCGTCMGCGTLIIVVCMAFIIGGIMLRSAGRLGDSPSVSTEATPEPTKPIDLQKAMTRDSRVAKQAAPLTAARLEDLAGVKIGELRVVDLGGGVKLELCGIPAGKFTMGSPPEEEGWEGGKRQETQHFVKLTKAFWIGRTEVTQLQWETVMGNNPSASKGKDLPVELVTWDDARKFCSKLNKMGFLPAGWKWALPTEAQWEYVCRAGSHGAYAGDLKDMAWFENNSDGKTHAVGTKKPNAWGVYDMHGNVWEWCADNADFPTDDYSAEAITDPTGPATGVLHISRGGGARSKGDSCRSAYRSCGAGVYRDNETGLRLIAVPADDSSVRVSVVARGGAKVGAMLSLDFGDGVKLDLCGIPAGRFTMGSLAGEKGDTAGSIQHDVTLTKDFWLGKTEVTQDLWEALMGNNPSSSTRSHKLPVESVSWDEVQRFITALAARYALPKGWQWALPTEAQWEYACRAGTTGMFAGEINKVAWYLENSNDTTHDVGTKLPNAWGLYDMHGNVNEWCADLYWDYSTGAVTNPVGTGKGFNRVLRGGSYGNGVFACRSASRFRAPPNYKDKNLGFRIAAVQTQ